MLARIVCDALRQSGYDAASAPDGERGLAMFSELRPALVVTDVMMPRSDGFRLTRRIRSVDREVPILFLSARSSSDDVVEGFASGGDDYLRKPFAMNELLERIEALLPYRPVCQTAGQRRQALAALLRIGGDSFTPEAVNDTLLGCGINARAEETGRPGYVEVRFPRVAGIPEGFGRMRAIIEEILPSHLDITYVFWYNTWAMAAERHPSCGHAQDAGLSWYGAATENDGELGWP